ncbi:unnamed protein product [Cuscuta epithymum]|uniref:Argonaute linker 1 domain-containing protein n=1 Tax=Cuscuta epithymum TaxID=186058 RepID=A0AAV0EZH6_9ASTE|nr:unnamed protein product [Cuscuta epithymum]
MIGCLRWGKNIYTAVELPFSSKDFSVKLADKDKKSRPNREFNVSIKHSMYHHLQQFIQLDTPQETIQVLDFALRANLSTKYQVVGRSFFASSFGEGRLDDGLEYWKGFYRSLYPCQMGLSLNIDVSALHPHERENSIANVVDASKCNLDNIVAEFGMKLMAWVFPPTPLPWLASLVIDPLLDVSNSM